MGGTAQRIEAPDLVLGTAMITPPSASSATPSGPEWLPESWMKRPTLLTVPSGMIGRRQIALSRVTPT